METTSSKTKLSHSQKYPTKEVQEISDGNANQTTKPPSTSENNQLTEIKEIEDTPFTAVRVDNKWFLALGKYRLTQPLPDYETCEKESHDASWNRIMQIMKIVIIEHEAETINQHKH